jgi:pectin methylesterase-like acyl-CoA thioesterase
MARVVVLFLVLVGTLASILPPSACQAVATKCEYQRPSGHGYKHPVGVRKVVVDAGGAGDFTSIQQAVDSVPVNNNVRVIMQINAGTYM